MHSQDGRHNGTQEVQSIENGCRQYVHEVREGRRKEAWPEKEAGLRQGLQEEVG